MNTHFFVSPSCGVFKHECATAMGAFPAGNREPNQIFPLAMAPKTHASNHPARADRNAVNTTIPVSSGLGAPGIPLPLWKRAIDLAICIVALPALGLCTLTLIILNRWVSPGPVFFRQERIGYMGRRFRIYKFRTMRLGADCAIHQDYYRNLIRTNAPMVKLDSRGDSRLIPFAWLLRASGLDELPQLINVLRGEMSLVGPRPCIPSEFAHYKSWQRQRCDALPGLTGLWQVSGKNRTTFEEMIRFDIQYARKCSFWLDLKIILLTVPCLLAQVRETRLARRAPHKMTQRSETKTSADSPAHSERESVVAPADMLEANQNASGPIDSDAAAVPVDESSPASAKPVETKNEPDVVAPETTPTNDCPAPVETVSEKPRSISDSWESLVERLQEIRNRSPRAKMTPEFTESPSP